MNTSLLRTNHKEDYEELFAKCQLVLSTDLDFLWSDDMAIKQGGLLLYQKLPLKMYLGFEKLNKEGVEIGSLKQYIPEEDAFMDSELDYVCINELIEYLEAEFDLDDGYRVHVVVEMARGRNISFSGPFCSMLVSGLAVLSSELKIDDFEAWEKYSVQDLMNDKSLRFSYIYSRAWKALSILRSGVTVGGCVLVAMIKSSYPVMYFARSALKKNCFAMRLNEIFDLPDKPSWSVDFSLIFSGNVISPEEVARSLCTFEEDLSEDISELMTEFKKLKVGIKDEEAGHFVGEFLREDCVYQKYLGMMHIVEVRMLAAMRRIFQRGFVQKDIREFFDSINHVRYGSRLVSDPIFVLNLMYYMIRETGRQKGNNLGVGAKFFGFGRMGGSLLLATPYRDMRRLVDNVLLKLLDTYALTVDYSSWEDGLGESGIKVEQCLDKKKYSDFIVEGSLVLKSFNGGDVLTSVASISSIQESSERADILLDLGKMKLMVGGQAVSSKDLHSQSALVELLSMCLESPQQRVANSNMPRSSYAQNKHELMSKVVLPFKRLLKKRLNKEISLEAEGSTSVFDLVLKENNNLQIVVVQRVN